MKISIQDLHPNAKTLACRLIDSKHNGADSIQAESLDDREKRFLRKHEIEYSFNSATETWEIQTK